MSAAGMGTGDEAIFSRREVLRAGAIGGAALAYGGVAADADAAARSTVRERRRPRPPHVAAPAPPLSVGQTFTFNGNWLFGGMYAAGAQNPGFADSGFSAITLPHTVTSLSWGSWNPSSWEHVWIYRKHFSGQDLTGVRVFLDFDGVMVDATVYLNGSEVGQHRGGYLPFSVELTGAILPGANVLAVVVDGAWLDQPPSGSANGPIAVDYLQPAGIYRDVRLRIVPEIFISDVFASPTNVTSSPGLNVAVTIDSGLTPVAPVDLTVELLDGTTPIASTTGTVAITGELTTTTLSLASVGSVTLWAPGTPKLYTVRTTVSNQLTRSHTLDVVTGFRSVAVQPGGLYLNGQRVQIFGLNRHQLFPYVGMAAPARLQARDAALLVGELNCNMVRCSHYPQSPAFLDACDQLGLMVWEEVPGWQYIGDPDFQTQVMQSVHDMVMRDRNRPSVIMWGTRLDESASFPTLYSEARSLADSLDGTRPTTGAMLTQSTANWAEDVFAYDDYATSGGNMQLKAPVAGVPYMVSESVGAISGSPTYRWIDTTGTLQEQARLHAQAHNQAAAGAGYLGLLGWAGFDYASLQGGNRIWNNLKTPGVLDTFRVAKPGASIYRAQMSPSTAPVILPAFYWDLGPNSPSTGPGPNAMFATNCQSLQISVGGVPFATATPDTTNYGALAYPPVFVNLTIPNLSGTFPDLTVVGLVGGAVVATLQMSSDTTKDKLSLTLDDRSIVGDGTDATRLTFRALDAYGNQRPYVAGNVSLTLSGPAGLIGDNPFEFQQYGGVGGAIVRSVAGQSGTVTITASHPTLGQASATLTVTAPAPAAIV